MLSCLKAQIWDPNVNNAMKTMKQLMARMKRHRSFYYWIAKCIDRPFSIWTNTGGVPGCSLQNGAGFNIERLIPPPTFWFDWLNCWIWVEFNVVSRFECQVMHRRFESNADENKTCNVILCYSQITFIDLGLCRAEYKLLFTFHLGYFTR